MNESNKTIAANRNAKTQSRLQAGAPVEVPRCARPALMSGLMLARGTASASFKLVQRLDKGCHRKNRPVLAGLLVAFVLLLNALAAVPALHECLHCDADQPAHTCAVTLFAQGLVDVPVLDVPVVVTLSPLASPPALASVPVSSLAEMFPPGRAPPVSVSNS